MITISFTSGQLMEIEELLCQKANDAKDHQLATYYGNMADQFTAVIDKLQELPGEKRVANLALLIS